MSGIQLYECMLKSLTKKCLLGNNILKLYFKSIFERKRMDLVKSTNLEARRQ